MDNLPAACTATFAVSCPLDTQTGAGQLSRDQSLNRFFIDVEKRALRIAQISVRDRDEALDLVQSAMIKLAQKYAERDEREWTPLFYRILQNSVRDWHRRQAVRNRVMVWFGRRDDDDGQFDPVASAPDPLARTPEDVIANREAMETLEIAIGELPARQQEAFMLRTFEGLDVAGTASATTTRVGSS